LHSSSAWFMQRFSSSRNEPVADSMLLTRPASFSIAFTVPLLLDSMWPRASGPIIHAFLRLLVSSLLPAHHLSWTEAHIGALMASDAFEHQKGGTGTGTAAAATNGTALRFSTRMTGQTIDWSIESKTGPSSNVSASPWLFVLRVRAPFAAMLPSLRAMLLQRVHKLLFRRSSNASSAGKALSPSSPCVRVGADVDLRKLAPLQLLCAPHQLPAYREAQKWMINYARAASTTAAQTMAPTSTSGVAPAAAHTHGASSSRSGPAPPPPLDAIVQQLHAQLLKQRAQRHAHTSGSPMQLYLNARTGGGHATVAEGRGGAQAEQVANLLAVQALFI